MQPSALRPLWAASKQQRTDMKTYAQSSNPSDGSHQQRRPADDHASSSSQAASSSTGPQKDSQENSLLALPLLIASSLSHINKQYIKMRRRRKWWSKMGGYPKVCIEGHTPVQTPSTAARIHSISWAMQQQAWRMHRDCDQKHAARVTQLQLAMQ